MKHFSVKETKFVEIELKEKPYYNKLVESISIDLNNIIASASCSYVNGIMYKNGLLVTHTVQSVTELLEIVEVLKINTIMYIVGQ